MAAEQREQKSSRKLRREWKQFGSCLNSNRPMVVGLVVGIDAAVEPEACDRALLSEKPDQRFACPRSSRNSPVLSSSDCQV